MQVRRINPTCPSDEDAILLRELFERTKGKTTLFERDKRHVYLKQFGSTHILNPTAIVLTHDIITRPSNRHPDTNRYEVIDHNKLVGSGGFSEIYAIACTLAPQGDNSLAVKTHNERVVKIQMFGQDELIHLWEEFQISRLAGNLKIKYPALLKQLDEHYKSYTVMKKLKGVPLQDLLDDMFLDQLTLSTYKRLSICILLLLNLKRLHEKGIIHRDLKPENVMMDICSNELELFDFGLSKFKHVDDKGEFLGSPGYIPVEVYEAEGTDEKSDIFSMAIMLGQLWFADEPGIGSDIPSLKEMEDYDFPNLFKEGTHDLNLHEKAPLTRTLLKMIRLVREKRCSIDEALDVFTQVREEYMNRKIEEWALEYKVNIVHHARMFKRPLPPHNTSARDMAAQLKPN